jgi:transcriptional regulator with XRE-family HTH domain
MSLQVLNEEDPTHEQAQFPKELQRLRLANHFKQKPLAGKLGVNPRTYISWEKGDRIPPLAMVMLLSWVLEKKTLAARFSQSQLLKAYMIDELDRQIRKGQGNQALTIEALVYMMQENDETYGVSVQAEARIPAPLDQLMRNQAQMPMQDRLQLPEESKPEEQLHILSNLMQIFAQRPDLIPVARDFMMQMVKEDMQGNE